MGGNDLLQADYPQHVSLSPTMAALWKNLMTTGFTEPHEQLRIPTDTVRGISRSATPPATLSTQSDGLQASAQEESGQGASVTSDTHIASERGRPQDAITEAKHLISDLVRSAVVKLGTTFLTHLVPVQSFHLSASTSPLSSAFLDKGLKLFFMRFLPTFQVIHQPTWSLKSASASLSINLIALGTLYMTEDGDRAKVEIPGALF
jgi:hypothetical protein